ncbi:MAG: LacI family DNA-binding transcriptional regulator [Propionibacteriaceae bacterium]|nr:LacI family DNA-binding transcriptional regulator [Propionibacteriaceae bacterium]
MAPSTPPTIHEVAALAGVSRSTVSRILNSSTGGPPETRKRVEAAASTLGYRPSSAARSLRSGRSDLIALIVGDIRQPYFGSLARSLEHAAEASGRGVLLLDIDRSMERLRSTLARARSIPLDGLVVAVGLDIDVPEIREPLMQLQSSGVSVVTVTQHLRYSPIPSVTVAHADAAHSAVETLRSKGNKQIALVVGDADAPHDRASTRGFLDALPHDEREHAAAHLILRGSFQPGSTQEAVTALLQSGHRPDAFVTTSTFATLGLLNALEDLGLRETADIVCTEHTEVLDFLRPRVMSYGVDYEEYASAILTTLDAAAEGRPAQIVVDAPPVDPNRLYGSVGS